MAPQPSPHVASAAASSHSVRALRQLVAPFEGADDRQAWYTLLTSLPPFVVVWYLMYRSLSVSYWLTLLLSVLGAGFAVRTFIVQHDCGHGSFFRSARLRVAVGRVCSLVTLVPYGYWRRTHAAHHATSGKLAERGVDIETLTVREYLALSPRAQLRYRVLRHPMVLFGLLPTLYFVVAMRWPGFTRPDWSRERRSIALTNVALVIVFGALVTLVGWRAVLLVQLPITIIASTTGVWLFYVQHQFEHTYWADAEHWDYGRAALEGSSYYALPAVLEWFTGYIGLHHVHHLSARVPSYRLTACHRASELLAAVPVISLRDGWRTMQLKLWDEEAGRMTGWPRHVTRRLTTTHR